MPKKRLDAALSANWWPVQTFFVGLSTTLETKQARTEYTIPLRAR